MKGRTPTADEKRRMRQIGSLPCIACVKDGHINNYISLHHIYGRTIPGAHMMVLPLCAPHHQHDDTDPMGRIGVHPYKARFEEKYGSQEKLICEIAAYFFAKENGLSSTLEAEINSAR